MEIIGFFRRFAFLSSQLGWRLLVYVVVASGALATVITGVQLYWDYSSEHRRISSEFEQLGEAYGPSLGLAVWNLDHDSIHSSVKGLSSLSSVTYVEVKTSEGRTFSAGQAEILEDSFVIKMTSPLVYRIHGNSYVLGDLTLVASLQGILASVFHKALLILLMQFLKTFTISAVLLMIFDRLVIRHLRVLRDHMAGLSLEQSGARVNLPRPFRNDELQALVDHINLMQDRNQASLQDIRQRDAQIERTHRLESLGFLAGGIAHDFNNVLAAIVGQAELIAHRVLSRPEDVQKGIDAILNVVDVAAALTRRLLVFAAPERRVKTRVDVVSAVSQCVALSDRSLGKGVSLRLQAPAHSVFVEAFSGDIETTIFNLLANSRAALPHGGIISVVVKMAADDAVLVDVSDNGVGIEPENLSRVFEPFFTTRPTGKGTGIGLTMVHAAVEHMNGSVEVTSTPGEGTSVSMILPVVPIPPPEVKVHADVDCGKREKMRVLLVDDDVEVLAAVGLLLADLGVEVTSFCDSQAALDAIESNEQDWNLVISDVVMPGISGDELFRRGSRLNPSLRWVLMSGFAEVDVQALLKEGVGSFLNKPVTRKLLEACLEQLRV